MMLDHPHTPGPTPPRPASSTYTPPNEGAALSPQTPLDASEGVGGPVAPLSDPDAASGQLPGEDGPSLRPWSDPYDGEPADTPPPPKHMPDPSGLFDAAGDVHRSRCGVYGNPIEGYAALGQQWAGLLACHLGVPVGPLPVKVVCAMLVSLKLGRAVRSGHHEDSWIDAVNYASYGHAGSATEGDRK